MRPNTRVLWSVVLIGALLSVAGVSAAIAPPRTSLGVTGRAIALVVAAAALMVVARATWRLRSARLAYEDRHLVVDLGTARPERVPIDLVECFFLGKGPSLLPGVVGGGDGRKPPETTTVIVRLAERASQWRQRDVKPTLGLWRDGYITIRGTWSEPIDGQLVRRLNERLVEVHRQVKKTDRRTEST